MLGKARRAYQDLQKDIQTAIALDADADPADPDVRQLKQLTSSSKLDSIMFVFVCVYIYLYVLFLKCACCLLLQRLIQYKEQGSC